MKGPAYRPPGVDTHIQIEFVDPDVPDATYNLSHATAMAVAVTESTEPITYAPGIYVLADTMRAGELAQLNTNVFLPVDDVEYLDYTWRRFRLSKTFTLQTKNGVDTLTVEFADPGIAAKSTPVSELTHVMMAAWPTGKILGALLEEQS
jgi:hypothetical protein